jgi:hypothetical protein
MFEQGFLFSLGFASGCSVFSFLFVGTVVLFEQFHKFLQKPKKRNGTIDIRQWQRRAPATRDAGGFPACRLVVRRFTKSNEKGRLGWVI